MTLLDKWNSEKRYTEMIIERRDGSFEKCEKRDGNGNQKER